MANRIEVDLSGKTAIVTGATSGIGKEIARGLARLGADVVIGSRDAARGEAARAELAKDGKVWALPLDVSSAASVRAFVLAFGARSGRLDILVNNAGAWFTDRRENADGAELTFATNVLGPHLLTRLLEPALAAAAPARVVNIVSGFASDYDASDLAFTRRKYAGVAVYAQSKQALRMLTWGQAARLEARGITVNAASPGFVKTDFNRNARGFSATMINLSARLFAVTPEKGADTPVWVAASPQVVGLTAKYFEGRKEKDGKFRDAAAIADLERQCEEMMGEAGLAHASRPAA